MKNPVNSLLLAGIAAAVSSSASAQLYQDDFDAGTSGSSWTAKLSAGDAVANFAFNYGSIGIPSAPHSVGGTTIGTGFIVNQSAGVFQGVSASPNGQSFSGDIRVRFDMWLNYCGPLGAGGNGTTQLASFGYGVTGGAAEWASASSGVMFAASLDGGSASDYRLYKNNALDNTLSDYAAGSQNNSAAYYTGLFAGQTAPAGQTTLYPAQTGTTDTGEIAFKWFDVTIDKVGNTISWYVDGNLMASSTLTGVTLAGNNMFIGLFDSNAASSTEVNDFLNTAIFDNVVVTAIPEPTTISLFGLAGLAFLYRRFRK